MRILVIGSGGREHALAWRLSQSTLVERVYGAPGNPGLARCGDCIGAGDGSPRALLGAAESVEADLTVVGPEAPLVAGVVDAFRAAGRAIVGPTAENARLEGSKIFAKEFFRRHRIPTADFASVDNREDARRALDRFRLPVVIKADGLAAGKGVVVAGDRAEADGAIQSLGPRLVIEEFLAGEEVSFIALCDGRDVVPLAPTQDHKRVNDGDTGPNTGGMGAYSDSRILTEAETERVLDTIIRPTVEATAFTGFLYAGLMMTADGPRVLEFNVRLGDPETQPLMQRLTTDFAPVLMSAAHGELGRHTLGLRRAGVSRIPRGISDGHPDSRHCRSRGCGRDRVSGGHADGGLWARDGGGAGAGGDGDRREFGNRDKQCVPGSGEDRVCGDALPEGYWAEGAGTLRCGWRHCGWSHWHVASGWLLGQWRPVGCLPGPLARRLRSQRSTLQP
jgi:phosphoribosylamine--glycine ligase